MLEIFLLADGGAFNRMNWNNSEFGADCESLSFEHGTALLRWLVLHPA